jgi:hypothetical protein
MLLSSRRYADTSVLSLVPLKHLALNAREVPSEPRSQPPRAEPLPTQAEDGPAMVAAVEEPSALPPLLMGGGGGCQWRRPPPQQLWSRWPERCRCGGCALG